ncbi:MAG: glycosyltransferase [Isosphaeraceae bacterium]|nr:glycosyltransferase [Isosphaeraceae bacterium]
MAITSTRRTEVSQAVEPALALAVADVNWYTTENLFREVQRPGVSTLLLRCFDYYNAWMRGIPPWAWGRALSQCGPRLWQRELVLPSGWMKSFPALGMRPIGRSIRSWWREHAPAGRLALVMTYPHYLYLRDIVKPDYQIYFNIDDYTQYWPRWAQRVSVLEQQAVREADVTVCVSRLRAEELRAAVPAAAERIRHLPHGSPTNMLSEHPWDHPATPPADLAAMPRPLLGYVGNLEDRVDWRLLDRLSAAFPHGSVVVVGKALPKQRGAWYADCERFLARPNVHALGWRPQDVIHEYNRSFDVCLIPYRTDHPFNRACSPTKIMDYMSTGRPIVSTALPECRLYDQLFHVAADEAEFIDAVREILALGSDDGRAPQRFDWASSNTCQRVAERLLDWLPV